MDPLFYRVARDEGLELSAYPDPRSPLAQECRRRGLDLRDYGHIPHWQSFSGDPWTIGYGHTGRVRPGDTITKEEADAQLRADLEAHSRELAHAAPWVGDLDAPRRRVLENMAFNMGVPKLMEFKNTLRAVRAGDYEAAAEGMKASLWYKQTGDRAKRLVAAMRTGIDP